jgi:hypothetical protein
MAVKIQGVTVINDSRGLENITSGLIDEVRTPEITFPSNGASGFSAIDAPNIKVIVPYYTAYGTAKKGTEIQIDNNSDFSSPLVDANELGTDTTFLYDSSTYSFATSTTYYIRVRHYDILDTYSEWSSTVSFTTPSTFSFITTPSITSPTTGAIDQGSVVSITSDAFVVTPNGADTHVSSDWQVATDSNFFNIVSQSIADTSNLTSYNVSGLSTSTTYYARVRYNGSTLTSEYSSAISFTTASAFGFHGMATAYNMQSFGDSYQYFLEPFTDPQGNKSIMAMGFNSSNGWGSVVRFGKDLTDEGQYNFGTHYDYCGGCCSMTSGQYMATAWFDSTNNPRMEFLDVSNQTMSFQKAITLENGYWISDLDTNFSASTTKAAGTGYFSNYASSYIFTFTINGMIASRAFSLSGYQYVFASSIAYLSDGRLAVVGEARTSGGQAHLFLIVFTNTNVSAYDHCGVIIGPYSEGNNQRVTELPNGNLLISDWGYAAEYNISGATPTLVNSARPQRADAVYKVADGNFVAANSQTTPKLQRYDSSLGANGVARQLDYYTTHEWFDTVYDSADDVLISAGKFYTGSAYKGFIVSTPGDITSVPTGSSFPNLSQWSWSNQSYSTASFSLGTEGWSAVTPTLSNTTLTFSNYTSGGGSLGSSASVTVTEFS